MESAIYRLYEDEKDYGRMDFEESHTNVKRMGLCPVFTLEGMTEADLWILENHQPHHLPSHK